MADADADLIYISLSGSKSHIANDLMSHLDEIITQCEYKTAIFSNEENLFLEVREDVERRIAMKNYHHEFHVVCIEPHVAILECALGPRHYFSKTQLLVRVQNAVYKLQNERTRFLPFVCQLDVPLTSTTGGTYGPDLITSFLGNPAYPIFTVEYADTEKFEHVLAKCMRLRHLHRSLVAFVIVKVSQLPREPSIQTFDPDFSEDFQVWVPLNPGDEVSAGNHTTIKFNGVEHFGIPAPGRERQEDNYELVNLNQYRRTFVYRPEEGPIHQVRGDNHTLMVPVALPDGSLSAFLRINLKSQITRMQYERQQIAIAQWYHVKQQRHEVAKPRRGRRRAPQATRDLDNRLRLSGDCTEIVFSDKVRALDEITRLLGAARRKNWTLPRATTD